MANIHEIDCNNSKLKGVKSKTFPCAFASEKHAYFCGFLSLTPGPWSLPSSVNSTPTLARAFLQAIRVERRGSDPFASKPWIVSTPVPLASARSARDQPARARAAISCLGKNITSFSVEPLDFIKSHPIYWLYSTIFQWYLPCAVSTRVGVIKPMSLASKITTLLEGFSRPQIRGLIPADRQRLSQAAERVLCDCIQEDAAAATAKDGVIGRLNSGERGND
jgi:hypothetical protein